MSNKKIIISGSTGFVGKSLVPTLGKEKLLFFNRYSFEEKNKPLLFNIKNEPVLISEISNNEITLLHLATHYSVNEKDRKKIYSANISFGEKILNSLNQIKIKKIIYTNTMFNFYENEQLKNCYYSETKKQFSKIIQSFSNEKSINYEEIYLDNTFGKRDKRKKIISEIAKCVSSNKENPIKNPDNLINILYIGDIINRLKYAIDNSTSVGTSAFVGKESYVLSSIYDFLFAYNKTNNKEVDLLKKARNYYTNDMPEIDYKNVKLHDIPSQLTKLI